MPEVCLGLPSLNLRLDAKKLQLSVSTTVKLTSLDQNLSRLSSEELLEAILSGSVWTRRGRGSFLDFRIEYNDKPIHAGHEAKMIQSLGVMMQNAPFWSLLGLCPELRSNASQFDPLSDFSFIIDLRYELPSNDSKIDDSNSVLSGIIPPEKIMVADFEKATLVMSFCDTSNPSEQATEHQKAQPGPTLLLTNQRAENIFSQDFLPREPSLLYHIDPFCSPLLYNSDQLLTFQRSMTYSHNHDQAEATKAVTLDIASAYMLMDAALRQIIGGRQTKRTPGIRIEKPYPQYALCDICPSMWSLGFLQNMSSRSRFIPKIATIFGTSVINNAQSPSLREKLDVLECIDQQANPRISNKKMSGRISAVNTAEAQIFKLTKLQIYDPASTRRLPTSAVSGADNIAGLEDFDIIESMYDGNTVEDMTYFERTNEFEDLLGEEDDQLEMLMRNWEDVTQIESDLPCVHEGLTPNTQNRPCDDWEDQEIYHDLEEDHEMLI